MNEASDVELGEGSDLLRMTIVLACSYMRRNAVPAELVPDILRSVHGALMGLARGPGLEESAPLRPAVPIRRSVHPEYIVCLEDGMKLKMLRRHLRVAYGMSPAQYRATWGLAADYPMVAPSYSEQRAALAKKIGLGRRQTGRRARGVGKPIRRV